MKNYSDYIRELQILKDTDQGSIRIPIGYGRDGFIINRYQVDVSQCSGIVISCGNSNMLESFINTLSTACYNENKNITIRIISFDNSGDTDSPIVGKYQYNAITDTVHTVSELGVVLSNIGNSIAYSLRCLNIFGAKTYSEYNEVIKPLIGTKMNHEQTFCIGSERRDGQFGIWCNYHCISKNLFILNCLLDYVSTLSDEDRKRYIDVLISIIKASSVTGHGIILTTSNLSLVPKELKSVIGCGIVVDTKTINLNDKFEEDKNGYKCLCCVSTNVHDTEKPFESYVPLV